MDNKRPTWAEIDLTAVRNNLRRVKEVIQPGTGVMAVVKANAYGHGMLEVSQVCTEEKVDYLAVATLDEALELRQAGFAVPILVLGYIPDEFAALVVANNIRPTVYEPGFARRLAQTSAEIGIKAKIHVKIDTGMGRIGFTPGPDSVDRIEEIASFPGIELEGIFTHFAEADGLGPGFTMQQLTEFKSFVDSLETRNIIIPVKHCANSAAIFRYPETHFNMVRAGIVLYGLHPSPVMKGEDLGITPAMTLKSRISMVKTLEAGQGVSYGRTHICSRKTRIATVPIGYADGYRRGCSNRAWAVIKGHKAPLLGVVCMDQCMFDISGREDIGEGDEVILFGKDADGVTADNLAVLTDTINYEIVCALSSRVPRMYVYSS